MNTSTPISGTSTVADLVDHWLRELRVEGKLEATTVNEYERVLRKLVVPRLGDLRLDELTTNHINAVLADLGVESKNGQRKAKVVTGAMLDSAVQLGALEVNPVRGSMSISRPLPAPRTLTHSELVAIREAVTAWQDKDRPGPRSGDMVDIVELLIATGTRIGEALALRWRDIDLRMQTVEINATIKTDSERGTYRKPLARNRLVALPELAVEMLLRRRSRVIDTSTGAVFPTRNGTWQQVNNVERRWRQIRREAGLDWVTPDVFRRGVLPAPVSQDGIEEP